MKMIVNNLIDTLTEEEQLEIGRMFCLMLNGYGIPVSDVKVVFEK